MRHLVFSNNGYIDDELKNLKLRECFWRGKGICWKADESSVFLREQTKFPFFCLLFVRRKKTFVRNKNTVNCYF